MSIQPPNGILDITGATLRVSKMEFSNVTGFDTVLNNVARNTVLHVDTTEYTANVAYAVKPPNMFMAQFDLELAAGGTGLPCNFNYYNDSNLGTSFNGYNLSFNDTSIILTYDGGSALHTATLSSSLNNGVYRKVKVLFDRDTTLVSINGENVFRFKDELRPRTYDTGTTGYIRWWHNSPVARKIKNLKVSNGEKWAQEYDSAGLSSNISYTHGLVGVGTSVPEYTLDVAGDIRASGNLIVNGSNTLINTTSLAIEDGVIECGKGNSSAAKDLGFLMVRNDGSSTTNSNVAMFWDESTDALTFGFSDSGPTATTLTPNTTKTLNSYFVGNVGIGTNNPLSTLEVGDGTSSTSGDAPGSISVSGTGATKSNGGKPGLYHRANVGLGLWSDAHMSFEVNGYQGNQTEAMRITTAGNVGIGVVDPKNKLDVRSDNYATFGKATYNAAGWSGIRLGTPYATNHDAYCSVIESYNNHASDYNSDLRFKTSNGNNASGNERMRITSGGNVGIGTVSPSTKLHVEHYGSAIGDFEGLRIANHATNLHSTSRPAYEFVVSDINNGTGIGNSKFAIGYRGTTSASRTDRLVIDNAGNVGIGTTDPSHPLTIQETTTNTNTVTYPLAIRAISSGTVANGFGAGIRFQCERTDTDNYQSLAGSVEVYGAGNLPGTSDLWNMRFGVRYNDTAITPMTLRYDGKVGIGTTNPTSLLHIVNPSTTSRDVTVKILGGPNQATNDASRATLELHDDYNNAQGWGGYIEGFHESGVNHGMGLGSFTNGSKDGYSMFIRGGGNVGIGTANPRFATEVYNGGLAVFSGANTSWQSTKASASNQGLIIGRTGSNPINGTSSKYWQLNMHNNDNLHVSFAGQYSGYVSGGTQNDQMNANFTGQHRTFIKDVPFSEASALEGLIVSANQNKYIKMSGGVEAGSNAITTNESLPVVSLSTTPNDKKCFGVISASEDPEKREEMYGIFGSIMRKEEGDTRVYINSVGEGAIWVTNENDPLESGDYITTSNVAGYGMKQEDDVLHNYTVAKITMDCDFSPATQPIQHILKELSNVNYWVNTTYSNVALEEYSNLAEENRTTIDAEMGTIYQKIERDERKEEPTDEGFVLEVREELVNVLDEHGQLQWEDHPTDTEKAYKIRYLTADGTQTDEANAVHIAAFVGCTYHCG